MRILIAVLILVFPVVAGAGGIFRGVPARKPEEKPSAKLPREVIKLTERIAVCQRLGQEGARAEKRASAGCDRLEVDKERVRKKYPSKDVLEAVEGPLSPIL